MPVVVQAFADNEDDADVVGCMMVVHVASHESLRYHNNLENRHVVDVVEEHWCKFVDNPTSMQVETPCRLWEYQHGAIAVVAPFSNPDKWNTAPNLVKPVSCKHPPYIIYRRQLTQKKEQQRRNRKEK